MYFIIHLFICNQFWNKHFFIYINLKKIKAEEPEIATGLFEKIMCGLITEERCHTADYHSVQGIEEKTFFYNVKKGSVELALRKKVVFLFFFYTLSQVNNNLKKCSQECFHEIERK